MSLSRCLYGRKHTWWTETYKGHRHCSMCGVHLTKREERECGRITTATSRTTFTVTYAASNPQTYTYTALSEWPDSSVEEG